MGELITGLDQARAQRTPTVVVVGGGAAGTLTALHLVRTAGRRATPVQVVVLDPADRLGRGTAYSTADPAHLLNVPASAMSALPEDPGHFVAWRRRDDPDQGAVAHAFAPRAQLGRYLEDTLADALADAVGTTVRHLRRRARRVERTSTGVRVVTDDGRCVDGEALVLAPGLPSAGADWAPEGLRRSAFFVPDPWAPGALDVVRRDRSGPADVLVVGSGLTTVDVVQTLTGAGGRPGRVVHVVSRSGRFPAGHAEVPQLPAIPDVSGWGTTWSDVRASASRHVAEVRAATGDWRPAVDGLRFRVAELWQRLDDDDRAAFLAEEASAWARLRHRVPPPSSRRLAALTAASRLTVGTGTVADATPLSGGGLQVRLDDGTQRWVGWVVNGTGPRRDVRALGDPLLDDLLRPRGGAALAVAATAGMGVRTVEGRLLDEAGRTDAPVWAVGALRRGELWESTAVPEIRTQALATAVQVLDAVAPLQRRLADGRLVSGHHPRARPRDLLGLPISTTADAAAAYNAGLERVMLLRDGAEDLLREATEHDPGFAAAHAALALLGHEAGATTDVAASLAAAREAVERRGDDRERSLVEVVGLRVADVQRAGASALLAHVAQHPRDVLAVSAAVPTIAFSGVTDLRREAWDLVEGLARAYGDHWWYASLLAFTRQDQERWEEAGLLAESALSCQPASGHAVHALAHVLYETGQHEEGRTWLDHWVEASGRSASHRAHFAWHAALHDLSLGDTDAVARRYAAQLAPPGVGGVRALVDSASLLWRWQVTGPAWSGVAGGGGGAGGSAGTGGALPAAADVLAAVEPGLLERPPTPFTALHAALALAAAGDAERLDALGQHCRRGGDATLATVVGAVCDALAAVLHERWAEAVRLLDDVRPLLVRAGGSAAQREVVDETLLLALVSAPAPASGPLSVPRVAVVVGNPRPGSRTLAAATHVARELVGAEPDLVVDLATVGAGLLERADPVVGALVEAVGAADLVVVACPTYKGTYTGLLKLFLDRFAPDGLRGVAVPLMLGAGPAHALAPETTLRPVLTEIGAVVPVRGLYVLDAAHDDPASYDAWLARARPVVTALLTHHRPTEGAPAC